MVRSLLIAVALVCVSAGPALGFPEFQTFIQSQSGRNVDCAFCHEHPDGPIGTKPGQIGSLDDDEMRRLNQARLAFEPGVRVDSPILNDFGDHILFRAGKTRIALAQTNPAELAGPLRDSDLDGDGITDDVELLEGTHPLMAQSGSPWRLLLSNARAYGFHLVMLVLATVLGLYGLNHLLRWFGMEAQQVAAPLSEPEQSVVQLARVDVVTAPAGAIKVAAARELGVPNLAAERLSDEGDDQIAAAE